MEILLSRFYIIFVLILYKYNYKNTPDTINSAIAKTYPCQHVFQPKMPDNGQNMKRST